MSEIQNPVVTNPLAGVAPSNTTVVNPLAINFDALNSAGVKTVKLESNYKLVQLIQSAVNYVEGKFYMNKNQALKSPQMVLINDATGDLYNVDIHRSINPLEFMALPVANRTCDLWVARAEKDWTGYDYKGTLYSKEDLEKKFVAMGMADWSGAVIRETKAGTTKLVATSVGYTP